MSLTFDQKLEAIDDLYYGEQPTYLKIRNGKVLVNVDGHFKPVTAIDIVEYFDRETRSLSGLRTIGSISGDWRMIDRLAYELLDIFKILSPSTLNRESSKYGIEF